MPLDLSLSSKTSALHLAQGLHSAEDGGCAQDGDGDQNVAQSHAAMVEIVHELDAKDGPEEGGMRQGSRAKCLGKVAQVGAENTEPLKGMLVCLQSIRGKILSLTAANNSGRVAPTTTMKTVARKGEANLVSSLKMWWI